MLHVLSFPIKLTRPFPNGGTEVSWEYEKTKVHKITQKGKYLKVIYEVVFVAAKNQKVC
jgi:hypothetical protein